MKVILDKYHWMLYYLVPAMYPRFMITLDEDLKNLPVTVRVGQVNRDLITSVVNCILMDLDRLSRLLARQESHGRSQDSKLTRHLYDWARQNERSWPRRSTFPTLTSSRVALF